MRHWRSFRSVRTTCTGSSTIFFSYWRLAAEAEKKALGDHTPRGYEQRARFYAISDEGRLNFARGIARYIVFLAENTGLAPAERCGAARKLLDRYATMGDFLADISR